MRILPTLHDDEPSSPAQLPGLPARRVPTAEIRDIYRRLRSAPQGPSLDTLLSELDVRLEVSTSDLERIPASGPLVIVANHPFGVLDGVALGALLTRVRPDVKVMTNSLLRTIPELREHFIFVDSFRKTPAHRNTPAIQHSVEWLRRGGAVAVFPAGDVSRLDVRQAQVTDDGWDSLAARLVRMTDASALPVFFCGRNSVAFQLLGLVNTRLRSHFLLQEFLQQRGKTIPVRIGTPIPAELVLNLDSDDEAIEYLRLRTYLLSYRGRKHHSIPTKVRAALPRKPQEPISPPVPTELLIRDLESLAPGRLLNESAEFAVYAARANEIPNLLEETARLREVTFRAAGEGTGKRNDFDQFDDYYWHLLLWSKTQKELVGAYRAGNTDEIIRAHGIKGLYTRTLFRYDAQLFMKIGSALELGRSFIRREYQRQYAPLLMLWKGIAHFVALHPETPVLFGAVSISNDYNSASREMIVRFFEARDDGREFADLIQPRTPFRAPRLRQWDCRAMCNALRDLDELAEPISDVEEDGKGLPILIRQYAKLGGKLVGFNLDRKFSDVVDGLVIVDLRQSDPASIERYMGKEGYASFRRYHKMS